MKNDNLNLLQDLPKGKNVYLSIPDTHDMNEFLLLVRNSIEWHYPWVTPPKNEDEYKKYIARIDTVSHIGFLIKRLTDHSIIGVININEIVMGVFQSGYLGFYVFKEYSGKRLMSEGLSLVLFYYFKQLKLHRLEANIQPDNKKSILLIKSKNFRHEGFSQKYLKINNMWRDHERFAMTAEDYR